MATLDREAAAAGDDDDDDGDRNSLASGSSGSRSGSSSNIVVVNATTRLPGPPTGGTLATFLTKVGAGADGGRRPRPQPNRRDSGALFAGTSDNPISGKITIEAPISASTRGKSLTTRWRPHLHQQKLSW